MPERRIDPARVIADAAALGVTLGPEQAASLLDFQALLLRWNRAFNLISRRDTARLLPRHLLDSLSVAPWLVGDRVLDLGTGAGLPGVPLAIARPDLHFTLVDRNERRIRFVARALRELSVGNVTAWCGDVRELAAEAVFDTVVSRAVAGVDEVRALVGHRLRPGGRLVVMDRGQGGDPEQSGEAGRQPQRGSRHPVRIPGLAMAHELVVLDDRSAS